MRISSLQWQSKIRVSEVPVTDQKFTYGTPVALIIAAVLI